MVICGVRGPKTEASISALLGNWTRKKAAVRAGDPRAPKFRGRFALETFAGWGRTEMGWRRGTTRAVKSRRRGAFGAKIWDQWKHAGVRSP